MIIFNVRMITEKVMDIDYLVTRGDLIGTDLYVRSGVLAAGR